MNETAASARVPDALVDLVTTDVLGHVVTLRPDGALAPAIVWVDHDGEHVLFNSPVGSRKGRNVRANPQVAVSVVDHRNPFRYLAIRGRVTSIRPDDGLEHIDRMSQRYTGRPYGWRGRPREIFEVTIDHVSASEGRR
ncbi:MAG TPA: TIGR03618 family F420-dependent PPOX class oxidoreductase [Candidatus Deferrimicrobiaceae bacterium]|nr:TIGR03618 family F420-dependent PPOX class oxidoreductase [Candidatus Deferrimicrobiaceae bacterium]